MAKKKEEKVKYTFPSRFGSHKSMLVKDLGEMVECQDEFGTYTTLKSRLDNGLSDPARCSTNRLGKLFSGKKEEK